MKRFQLRSYGKTKCHWDFEKWRLGVIEKGGGVWGLVRKIIVQEVLERLGF